MEFDYSLVQINKAFLKNIDSLNEIPSEYEKYPWLEDIESMENFEEKDMVPDEDKDSDKEINENIQKISYNDKKNEKIFKIIKVKKKKKTLPKYPDIERLKIRFRARISKSYKINLNNEIKKSDLPKDLKKEIYSPHYKKFTRKVKCETAFKDLKKPMSDILCIGKEKDNKRKKNYENIKAIRTFNEKNPKTNVGKIIELLDMTYEEVIEKFYESRKLEEVKKEEVAKFYDEELVREKNISLFEKNGLIRLTKSYFASKEKNETMLRKRSRC